VQNREGKSAAKNHMEKKGKNAYQKLSHVQSLFRHKFGDFRLIRACVRDNRKDERRAARYTLFFCFALCIRGYDQTGVLAGQGQKLFIAG
jgi:hypothetical protein